MVKLKHIYYCWLIWRSGLFDRGYYQGAYQTSPNRRIDPLWHYLRHGWQLGYNPSPGFDTAYYLKANRDVRLANINPLLHYILAGRAEGRPPKPDIINLYPRYAAWRRRYDRLPPFGRLRTRVKILGWQDPPRFTLFISHQESGTPQCKQVLQALQAQFYPHWRAYVLCPEGSHLLFKDPRVEALTLVDYQSGLAKAVNAILADEPGDYFTFLEPGILPRPHALLMFARAIQHAPSARLLYADQDHLTSEGQRQSPWFKPGWNPELLLRQCYPGGLCFFNTAAVRNIAGLRSGFGRLTTWDLALRLTAGCGPDEVQHLPYILSHRTAGTGSPLDACQLTSADVPVYQRMLREHFARQGRKVAIDIQPGCGPCFRYPFPAQPPLVSILIPTHNQGRLLARCIESIREKTTYPNTEIIIIDNNSDQADTLACLSQLDQADDVRVIGYAQPFNYAAINNFAAWQARGTVLLFLNDDTRVQSPGWLDELVRHALRPEVGAVGAMLHYPDGTIQHAGVVLGLLVTAGHIYHRCPGDYAGPYNRLRYVQNVSAVTGACLAVEKAKFNQVGGFDVVNLPVTLNDVDLCLRLAAAGYQNVWTPFARLWHEESASRGHDRAPEKQARAQREAAWFKNTWGHLIHQDPAYNPNLSFDHFGLTLAFPPRHEKPY